MVRFSLLALLFLVCSSARADWTAIGAATRCDTREKTFVIVPTLQTSDPSSDVLPPPGFKRLHEGVTNAHCQLSSTRVTATIAVYPPADRGECMGQGYIEIRNLVVGGVNPFSGPEPFNWYCLHGLLTKVSVHVLDSRTQELELCRASSWEWGKGYVDVQCTRTRYSH